MGDVQVHWFSIVNSIVVVFFLAGNCNLNLKWMQLFSTPCLITIINLWCAVLQKARSELLGFEITFLRQKSSSSDVTMLYVKTMVRGVAFNPLENTLILQLVRRDKIGPACAHGNGIWDKNTLLCLSSLSSHSHYIFQVGFDSFFYFNIKNNRKTVRYNLHLITNAKFDFVKNIFSLQTKREKLKVNYATYG